MPIRQIAEITKHPRQTIDLLVSFYNNISQINNGSVIDFRGKAVIYIPCPKIEFLHANLFTFASTN